MSLLRGVSLDHLVPRTRKLALFGVHIRCDAPVMLTVRYIGDIPLAINAARKLEAGFTAKTTARERFDAMLPIFVEHAALGWENVVGEDGNPVAFYADGVVEIMNAYADKAMDLAARAITFPNHINNFRDLVPPDPGDLGKE